MSTIREYWQKFVAWLSQSKWGLKNLYWLIALVLGVLFFVYYFMRKGKKSRRIK